MCLYSRDLYLLGVLIGLLSGCGPSLATIQGAVTVDGRPLENGVISFVPDDGQGDSTTANVQSGKYHLQATPGKKRVQISAPVVAGRRQEYNSPDAPWVEITKESLPDHYHANTQLTFVAQPGDNLKDWSLDTRARPR